MTTHFAPDQDGYFEPEFTRGDRLRKAREMAGLSQEQLADELGIHKNTVSNYESDTGSAKHATLVLWSMRTRVSLAWLKGNDAPPPPKGERPRRDSNPGPTA